MEQETLATTERLKSLSVIAGAVAHDLNNVLGPLVALPETIRNDLGQQVRGAVPAEVLQDLTTISQAGQRAAHVIQDLLALGRLDEMPETLLELSRLLESERATFAKICEGREAIPLRIESSQRPLVVRASREHLVRAISNLVIHAADAIEGPGLITVRVVHRCLAERLEGIECVEAGHYAVVEVIDTGVGIAAEHLPHVLARVYRVRVEKGEDGAIFPG